MIRANRLAQIALRIAHATKFRTESSSLLRKIAPNKFQKKEGFVQNPSEQLWPKFFPVDQTHQQSLLRFGLFIARHRLNQGNPFRHFLDTSRTPSPGSQKHFFKYSFDNVIYRCRGDSGGVRVRFRVRFQFVKVSIFGWIPSWELN